jgi:ABC-type antimicrobial peptide transport system permease subunit
VPIIEGRDFTDRDTGTKPVAVIVNRKFARHYFGDRPAIGRHVGWGGGPQAKLTMEIVGVTEDTLYEGPREGVRRQVFVPRLQMDVPMGVTFYVRGNQSAAQMIGALRSEVKKLDASLPVYDVKTLGGQLDETLLTERLIAKLSAAFGALATLLAALGLYGVMAFVVVRRTKEIGVRMALGASQGSVVWMVMREVLLLLGIGLAAGIPAAYGLARYVSSQLFGIQAADPAVGLVTVSVLAVVAAGAGLVPALRASSVDPMLALRYE